MMNLTQGGDTQSEAALMVAISDPTLFANRLQALAAKAADAQKFVEQAKAENEQTVAERKHAEEINAATVETLRQITAKDHELQAREAALANRANDLASREAALADRQAKFEENSHVIIADHDKREQALYAAEQAFTAKVEQHRKDMATAIAAKMNELEADHQAKLAAVKAREDNLYQREQEANVTMATAEQQKALYEGKLVELRRLTS